ncbi:hypothetical protein [Oceanospirillum linum]|uniref:Uncharacterized protein n=1 Tax=Oceanospirillum linum TaxID=966 RepID=A0A1T1H8Z7_OCELI|nr:hypothetical protein [Oceanospirillum linum]OOV86312.1 hypothetical protein BTA35_0213940 [Oceanospirillum linum]SEG47378.1 hypothetical protein SAMN04489856_11237 [Oleiphilus messinensis]SMP31054.1 hypothetical protein SAMN06264348_10854 [Oceanospirillum linum]
MPRKIVSLDEYRSRIQNQETRVAWQDFPPVFIFRPLGAAKNHPKYELAKMQGSDIAAYKLVKDITPEQKISELSQILDGRSAHILPIHAIEEFGTNKIPAALAFYLANKLNCELCSDIVQANRPQRTGKGAFYRLSQYPFFDGKVVKGQNYVILAIALTGHPGAASLNIKDTMLNAIRDKHGDELNEWWKSEIGFGLDKLTQGEAGHLKKAPSFAEITSRVFAERPEE